MPKKKAKRKKAVVAVVAAPKPVRTVNVYAIDRLQAAANKVWTFWCIRFNATNPNRSKAMAVKYGEAVAELMIVADALVDPHHMMTVPVVM